MNSPTLTELARQLSRSDLKSRDVQCDLYDRLQQERERFATEHAELCGFLDAAAILVRSLAHLDETGTEEVRELVTRIVRLVSSGAPSVAAGSAPGGASERSAPVPDSGLQTLNEMALGQVLVQLGIVRGDGIERALAHRVKTGKRLGESLVELGLATDEDIAQALRLQHALSTAAGQAPSKAKRPSAVQSILLGEILVHLGKIDRKALEEGLELQRKQGLRLGDALVELGWASWADVADGLRVQEERGGSSERGAATTVVDLGG